MYFLVKKTIAMILWGHIEMGGNNRLGILNSIQSRKRTRQPFLNCMEFISQPKFIPFYPKDFIDVKYLFFFTSKIV